jgi:hypothetical protein
MKEAPTSRTTAAELTNDKRGLVSAKDGSDMKDSALAPVAAHRMLPLQSLEAVYAALPHYANPEDIPVSTRHLASGRMGQQPPTGPAASAQLLGSKAASPRVPAQSTVRASPGLSPSSAFELTDGHLPSTIPAAKDIQPSRQRYNAPQNLIIHGRSVYVDAPTIVKGRLRYDRQGRYGCSQIVRSYNAR